MQFPRKHTGLNLLLFVILAGGLLREKQRGFPATGISLLLPCSLIYLGHKDSFPALVLYCPLSLSKSTIKVCQLFRYFAFSFSHLPSSSYSTRDCQIGGSEKK